MTQDTHSSEETTRKKSRRELSRRDYLKRAPAAAVTPGVVGSPTPMLIGLSDDGPFTPLATSLPDVGISHGGDNTPSWYLSVDEGALDGLRDWVAPEQANGRKIVREHESLDAMTVRASYDDVGLRVFRAGGLYQDVWGTSGLHERSWVQTIDRNIRMSYPEPIQTLSDRSAWQWDLSWAAKARLWVSGSSTPSPDGVAFDGDAEETTMDQHKADLGADTVSVDTSTLTVAIIDTGVNGGAVFEDESGSTRILDASTNLITDETVGGAGLDAIADGNDHGTWCTSCAAARAPTSTDSHHEGYLPAASILGLKALDDSGSGSTADIVAAVEIAADEGADLAGLSLGSPFWSAALDEALEYAATQGTVPVVAAGNDRYGTTWAATPSDSEWAISVSANTVGDPSERLSANFANVGPDPGVQDLSDGASGGATPDLTAPGMKTTALTPSGPVTLSGTSMAAPNVLGVAGLVQAAEGGLSYEDLRERLTTYHQPVEKIAVNEAQYGCPNAKRAIDQTEPDTPQSDAMTDEAETRSASYEALSNAQGGLLTR